MVIGINYDTPVPYYQAIYWSNRITPTCEQVTFDDNTIPRWQMVLL